MYLELTVDKKRQKISENDLNVISLWSNSQFSKSSHVHKMEENIGNDHWREKLLIAT